jgi:Flp pilus assembly pilin Flp
MMAGMMRKKVDDESGISIAELLVAAFISVLLLTMIGAFFTSVVRGTQTAGVSDTNTRQASTAMAAMVQYLHAATTYPVATQTDPLPAFVSVAPTDVTFYAYVNLVDSNAKPVKVRYYVDSAHRLVEQLWSSTCNATTSYCTFATAVTSQVILADAVASPNNDGSPLFTYLDSTQTATTTLSAIQYVGVNLETGSATAGTSGDAHISTVVGLLNLGQTGGGS